ncbi:hypothetical protein [Bradyrhizobium sp. Ai1a-2]|uniref:phage adaptor protein n=1 Tax=Bradyrhizobium sp. Ai1a-2 TaxID=196490 RepID=UPI0003FDEC36|nr:hypothetical protein [Bradyrhizobium sp. Ai1a-2]
MTTSGTFNFGLSGAGLAVAAYSRIQVRRTAILPEHMQDAFTETNLMLSKFSNLQPNLWTVDLISVPLIQGQQTYTVDPSTIQILDAYLSFPGAPESDRLIFPISRTEYASFPNKLVQAVPSVFWFDRLINPTITLWQVPDATGTMILNYYRVRQIQDANIVAGEMPELPYRFQDCMVAELAHRLSRIWKPEVENARKTDMQEAWKVATTQDVETDPDLFIVPQIGNYTINQ